jgi:hypothetical protein
VVEGGVIKGDDDDFAAVAVTAFVPSFLDIDGGKGDSGQVSLATL